MSDRFTEEEARRVFARAAERQHAEDDVPPGLSRAELEEIGRAAGLDPAHVAAAIAEVRAGTPDTPSATVWGIDLEPRATRVLPVEVTDAAWEQIVARLRETFGTRGTPTDIGRVREWTGANAQGGQTNLHTTVEPVEGGTRVTIATSKAHEVGGMRVVPWMFGLFGVGFSALVGFGDFEPGIWALPASMVLIGALMTVGIYLGYARWSVRRQSQFEALLDQIELIARDAASEPASWAANAHGPEAERLDLDALSPEVNAASASESRRRERS